MKPFLRSITAESILKVEFFKRDELTTDLVCCEVIIHREGRAETWFFHEEAPEWQSLLELVEQLPGFDQGWPDKVMKPPFAENRTVAFTR